MSIYYPDKWVVVKIVSPQYGKINKVLASWYGGFAGSNSWKLSSGIVSVTKTESGYDFLNDSGSIYSCHKDTYGMSAHTASVYSGFVDQISKSAEGNTIEIVDEEKIDTLEYHG